LNHKTNEKESSIRRALQLLQGCNGWVTLEVIAQDLAAIVNQFVRGRPQKNRGVNIDVFVCKTSFHEQASELHLDNRDGRFWIDKTLVSALDDQKLGEVAIHFLGYQEDFMDDYGNRDSFILEIENEAFCLVSNFRRRHHGKVSSALASRVYPSTTRSFLTSLQMYDIITRANKTREYDLRVRADYYRERIGTRDRRLIEYNPSTLDDLPTVDETFREKRMMRAQMTMYKLIAANPKTPLEITFSGDGHIGLYAGDFEDIYFNFIRPIASISATRIKAFSNRSMSQTSDKRPRPISISFASEPFSSAKGVSALLQHIQRYPHCNFSLMHSGNPHLYMYIMDKQDHSTFSLRTLGTNKVVISPQIETSAESMARFTQHLLSNLSDGEVE
jgi:hypothetical protein